MMCCDHLLPRKTMLAVSFALTGVPLFLTLAVPKDQFWVIIVLAYTGETAWNGSDHLGDFYLCMT